MTRPQNSRERRREENLATDIDQMRTDEIRHSFIFEIYQCESDLHLWQKSISSCTCGATYYLLHFRFDPDAEILDRPA
jgi:hypothetical protein